jgi:hypothetical protein
MVGPSAVPVCILYYGEITYEQKLIFPPNAARIAKPDQNVPIADTPSVSSASSVLQSKRSRASTPLTDISSSHPHDEEFVLPPPTEEMLARRAQSDYASAEIGKKLLQGWAMLADECPNSTCYGVPLLRPPRRLTDGSVSTKVRKMNPSISNQS